MVLLNTILVVSNHGQDHVMLNACWCGMVGAANACKRVSTRRALQAPAAPGACSTTTGSAAARARGAPPSRPRLERGALQMCTRLGKDPCRKLASLHMIVHTVHPNAADGL